MAGPSVMVQSVIVWSAAMLAMVRQQALRPRASHHLPRVPWLRSLAVAILAVAMLATVRQRAACRKVQACGVPVHIGWLGSQSQPGRLPGESPRTIAVGCRAGVPAQRLHRKCVEVPSSCNGGDVLDSNHGGLGLQGKVARRGCELGSSTSIIRNTFTEVSLA